MRTLSIGNSFSQDACAYLHDAAASAGVVLETVNLYIGGCSLEYHAENLRENRANYQLEINGRPTGREVSIREALTRMGSFDFITLQQASHFSGKWETYRPFLDELAEACRKEQPGAELMIHETWAYEIDSSHWAFEDYGWDQHRMYELLQRAYLDAAKAVGAGMIPTGDIIERFRYEVADFDYPHGGESLCRDGFHLSIPTGRFLAALVWLETLAGTDARRVSFLPEGMTEERRAAVAEAVHRFVGEAHSGAVS